MNILSALLLVLALLTIMISVNYTPKLSASSLSSSLSESLNFTFVKNIGPSQEQNPEDHIFQPEGVDIDSKGNIYVNDISQNRILKFSSNGTYD